MWGYHSTQVTFDLESGTSTPQKLLMTWVSAPANFTPRESLVKSRAAVSHGSEVQGKMPRKTKFEEDKIWDYMSTSGFSTYKKSVRDSTQRRKVQNSPFGVKSIQVTKKNLGLGQLLQLISQFNLSVFMRYFQLLAQFLSIQHLYITQQIVFRPVVWNSRLTNAHNSDTNIYIYAIVYPIIKVFKENESICYSSSKTLK